MGKPMPTGDPRMPNAVRKYVRPPPPKEEDQPPDFVAIAGAIFGMGGTIMRWKACAWLAAFCCASSLTNVRTADGDMKQLVSNVTFSFTGLMVCYLSPSQHHGAAPRGVIPGPVGAVLSLFGYNRGD